MHSKLVLSLSLGAAMFAACGAPGNEVGQDDLETQGSEIVDRHEDLANEAIPDNDPNGIHRILGIDYGWDVIRTARVNVRVRHTYRGDLRVVLTSPEGTEIVLHDQTGGSADNLSINRLVPDVVGQRVSGTWQLRVSDHARQDTGTLESWSLRIDHVEGPSPCATMLCGPNQHCELEPIVCIRAPCLPIPVCVDDEPVDACATVRCAAGTHCEVVQVECIRAPCPPIAQCVPDAGECNPDECTGPRLLAPNYPCWDGSTGGPACMRGDDGICSWGLRECPAEPQGPFCGSRGNQVYCAANEYCHHEPNEICGWADAQGECRTKPEICNRLYAPVCGCDNQTYGNACSANAAGVSVQHEGPCAPQGTWDEKGADFGSTNPYRNNQTLEQTYYAPPDATKIRLHFDRFATEAGYDFVTVYDANGNELARWSGTLDNMLPELDIPQGTNVRVVFTSDYSIVKAGFHINAISWFRVQ